MQRTIILLLGIFISIKANSQTPNLGWAKSVGGSQFDFGFSIGYDNQGNSYTTGKFLGTVDFDPGTGVYNMSSSGGCIYILKLSSSGNFVWAKQIGGSGDDVGQSLKVDAAGNILTTGSFWGTADFDPGAGVFNMTSIGTYDIFISKLDSAGNFIWAKRMGGNIAQEGFFITTDAALNIYTTGWFQGTADFDPGAGNFSLTSQGFRDVYISKLNSSGNFIWAKSFGGTNDDHGYSIAIDNSDNVYTTGFFQNTADFDPGAGVYNLTSSGQDDIFILKLNSSGNFVWAGKIGGSGNDYARSIAVDAAGIFYLTGTFSDTADFDFGAGVSNLISAGAKDLFILSFNAAGNFGWVKRIGDFSDEEGFALAVDNAGYIYVTGYLNTLTCDFDPGPGIFNLNSNGSTEIFLLKLTSGGNFFWAGSLGGTSVDYGYSIAVDASSNIYMTGWFAATGDYDPGPGTFNLTCSAPYDFYILRLKQCITPSASITANGPTTFCAPGTVTLNANTGAGYIYQWKLNGSSVSGATSSSYTASATGNYTCYVSDTCGTTVSNSISVIVNPLPAASISAGGSLTFCSPGSVTLTANTGTGLTYQWRLNSAPITGATAISFVASAAGNYDCMVTNNCGTVASNSLTVIVSGACSAGLIFTSANSNRVTISNNAAYSFGTGDFTFECWMKASSTQTSSNPVIFSTRMVSVPGILLYLSNGKPRYIVGGAAGAEVGNNLRDNICHHVSFTRSGTTVNLYIDGNLVSSQTGFNQNVTSTHAVWIGVDELLSFSNFNGMIHEVRLWNVARSQAQIQASMNNFLTGSETGLAGYWKLNEGSGQTVQDFSTVGNNGVLGSTASVETIDPAFSFTGCMVACTATASITAGGPITFCAPGTVTLNANTGNGLSYQWNVNGSPIGGATLSSYIASANGSYSCAVAGTCGTATSNSITVTVIPLPSIPFTPTGATIVCRNTTGNLYSVPSVTGATSYTWTVPSGATISSGQGTNSVSINFGSAAVSGNICVTSGNSCGNSSAACKAITVVTSIPTTPASITGTTLPCANSSAVPYSCPVVSNAASYNWVVPSTATIASGQGTNSITVNFGSTFSSGNVQVQSVNCYGVSSYRYLAVRGKPSTPGSITGQATGVCAGTNNVSYSIAAVTGATTYNWTAPLNATIAGGQGTNSVTINYSGSFTSGTLSVTAGNVCGSSSARTLAISSIPALPGTITGPVNAVCAGTSASYSIVAIAGATSYLWTAPANASIASGQGTVNVTVNYSATFTTGTLSVKSVNACGTSASRTATIKSTPSTPGTITGQSSAVCAGTNGVAYSIAAVSLATSYTWTAPLNATIASGQGTTSVTVNYGASFTSGTLSVTADNTCGQSTARTLAIASVPAIPGSITGQINAVCAGTNGVPYSVAAVSGATSYLWTAPVNATIASGQGTRSVTVNYSGAFTTGTLSVKSVNACGASGSRTATIKSVPSTPGSITGAGSVCTNQSGVAYSIAAVTSATTYNWTVPAGATVASGQGTTSITVNFGVSGGSVKVQAGNACGFSAFQTKTVSITCKEISENVSAIAADISLYPNPFTTSVTFISENDRASIRVYDCYGRLVESHDDIPMGQKIECCSTLAGGIYMAEILFSENRKLVKLIKQE
jgi:hypothetical protein